MLKEQIIDRRFGTFNYSLYFCRREEPPSPFIEDSNRASEPIEITAKFNGGLRYAPQKIKRKMKIKLNYFDDQFSITNADFSKIQPFSHADVVVNCDQTLSSTGGELERKVEHYLSNVFSSIGVKAKWDKETEWYQLQQRERNNSPRINKLRLGIDFEI